MSQIRTVRSQEQVASKLDVNSEKSSPVANSRWSPRATYMTICTPAKKEISRERESTSRENKKKERVTNTRGIAQRNSWYKRNHSNSNIDAASWRLLGRHACSMERKHASGTNTYVHIHYLPVVRQRAPAPRSLSAGRSLYPPPPPTPSLLLGRCHDDACPSVLLLLVLASGHDLVVMRR